MNALLFHAIAATSYGALLGAVFGPLRLAGVDYSKWYRNPGEISESNDRTWIGLVKWTALATGRRLLAVLVAVQVIVFVLGFFSNELPGEVQSLVDQFDLVQYLGPVSLRGIGLFVCVLIGLIVGCGVIQFFLDVIWRIGLRLGPGRSLHIRLARRPPTRLGALAAPAAGRRRLIACCDGTWNWPVPGRETNVVQLLRGIKPLGIDASGTPVSQIAYYHQGVGTGNFVDYLLGGGAGVGLSNIVKECYGFLVDNYRLGDEILLFGFSRGAYVARSVAGMIGLIGLLQKDEMFRFVDAWNYYTLPQTQRHEDDLTIIAPNRRYPVEIKCIGVWDTVGALGIPGTRLFSSAYAFHDTSLGQHVRYALQALSIDEQRGNFQPAVWVKQYDDQVLEQVWFPGAHSDIGGGYVEHGSSDAALLWMLWRLQRHQLVDCDVACIEGGINRYRAQPYAKGWVHDSRSLFFKAIACAIPRPVGITDDSEKIHQSALARGAGVGRSDPYARKKRRIWLESLPQTKVADTSRFERDHAFQGPGDGQVVTPVIPPRGGLSGWLLRWVSGQA